MNLLHFADPEIILLVQAGKSMLEYRWNVGGFIQAFAVKELKR
jgi:hypothetical protein